MLLEKFHKANNFEILADFFLGALGLAHPVRRQFDSGYDFYCYLSQPSNENANLLKFDHPFLIQIKSSSRNNQKILKYGKTKSTKWKKEDIDWLFGHETPFFLGFLDTKRYELKIYDTTGLWYLFVYEKTNCTRITFQASTISTKGLPLGNVNVDFDFMSLPMRKVPIGLSIPNWPAGKGDGQNYIVDLGNPIATLNIEETKSSEKLSQVRDSLRTAIEIEQRNIVNKKIGLNFFEEIKNNIPNNPQFVLGSTFNTHTLQYSEKLKIHLRQVLISLLTNTNDSNLKLTIKELLKQLPQAYFYSQLYNQNPDLFDWIKEEN
jgi:hypothetical protein